MSDGSLRFAGQNVVVMGLGRHGGGVAAARYLLRQGARVTVSDAADAKALGPSLAALADWPEIRWRLGGHEASDFRRADVVVVNPAVRPGHPMLEIARRCGARLTSEIELLLEACPASVIGVTGTHGKSTTAAMIAAVLRHDRRRCWLGGNIGRSLLPVLPKMQADDWVVLELSSFQLHHLSSQVNMPRVAVVTGYEPNHLDWHGSQAAYRRAKRRLLAEQQPGDVAILSAEDRSLDFLRDAVRGHCVRPPEPDVLPPLRVFGTHARRNAALAAAVGQVVGCGRQAVAQALARFPGMPHRLRRLGCYAGRWFFNDSKSTTPGSLLAALDAMPSPTWLLCGGQNKGLKPESLGRAIAARVAGVACFGAVGPLVYEAVRVAAPELPAICVSHLDDALRWCVSRSAAGDAVLLSPGFASLDQYRDFAERGRHFEKLVSELPATNAPRRAAEAPAVTP